MGKVGRGDGPSTISGGVMKFADGGYIPCPNGTAGMAWGPEPGEYIFARDGRIWRVSDDGERIDRIDAPQEES